MLSCFRTEMSGCLSSQMLLGRNLLQEALDLIGSNCDNVDLTEFMATNHITRPDSTYLLLHRLSKAVSVFLRDVRLETDETNYLFLLHKLKEIEAEALEDPPSTLVKILLNKINMLMRPLNTAITERLESESPVCVF